MGASAPLMPHEQLARDARAPTPLCRVIFDVAEIEGLPVDSIRSARRRSPQLFRARCAIAAVGRFRRYSYWQIGRAINRDHSSVVNQCRRADEMAQRDAAFDALVKGLADG